MHVILISNYT